MAVPSVRTGTERYVVRIFGTKFNLVRYVERISVRNLLIRYGVRILVRDFNWYGIPMRKKLTKNVDFRAIFFEIGMEPFIFPIFAPYQVPYRKKSGLKIRTTYLTRKFRTKIRTGTDFR